MAALNFPDPNVQTSYTNPDTGISYEWSNGIWKAVRTAQTAPELFVDVDGDNLTGNLTLGTDKIVLDATDGSATFANNVGIGTQSPVVPCHIVAAAPGIRLQDSDGGYVDLDANGGSLNLRADQGNTQASSVINFTIDGTERARIEADGSATFAGQISGNSVIQTDRFGTHVQMGASSSDAFRVGSEASGTIRLKYDGSATFNNTVTGQQTSNNALSAFEAVDTNGTRFKVTGAGVLSLYDNSLTENVQISSDGSAEFDGAVQVGGDPNQGTAIGVKAYPDGSFATNQTTATNKSILIFNGGTNPTAFIQANGVANFGTWPSRFDINTNFIAQYNNSTQPNLVLRKSDSLNNDDNVLQVQNNLAQEKASITGNGAASFAGGLFSLAANGGLQMGSAGTDNGVVLSMIAGTNPAPSAYTLFQGLQSNGSTQAFAFKVDGSATFAGTITANGYSLANLNTLP